MDVSDLQLPVIAAPMAGGASTPALVTAVGNAGGLGFLAAGYLGVDALRGQIAAVREATAAPFGVNLFMPGPDDADEAAVERYARRLRPEADRYEVGLGAPRWDDDAWAAKRAALLADPVACVSFTFGCPSAELVNALQTVGTTTVVTVTTVAEARVAAERGVDAVCAQGLAAGGHRGSFLPDEANPQEANDGQRDTLELVSAVRAAVDVPVIAAGGIAEAAQVRAALAAGAVAAQVGTAFLRSAESGASALHKRALVDFDGTTLTRAFTGKPARGLTNRFIAEHDAAAPAAYPHIHHLTRPVRAAAVAVGDPQGTSLWAGTGHASASDAPAADILRELTR